MGSGATSVASAGRTHQGADRLDVGPHAGGDQGDELAHHPPPAGRQRRDPDLLRHHGHPAQGLLSQSTCGAEVAALEVGGGQLHPST